MINTVANKHLNFTEKKELYGHTNFRAFEEEHDDLIIYADGGKETVIEALLEPIDYGTDMNSFNAFGRIELYYFDGWYVALK